MKKEVCKLSLPLLYLCTVNTVMIYWLFCYRFYPLNTGRRLVIASKSVQFFFAFKCAILPVQTSGWTERFKQVHRHYLILDSDQILLSYLLSFSFDILTHTVVSLGSRRQDLAPVEL
jgi:hypothetical protein